MSTQPPASQDGTDSPAVAGEGPLATGWPASCQHARASRGMGVAWVVLGVAGIALNLALALLVPAVGPAWTVPTLAGALAALVALGWTHVRRDVGPKTGLAYAFAVLLTPWSLVEDSSSLAHVVAALLVMVCFLYAVRLARRALEAGEAAPARWWAVTLLAAAGCGCMGYASAVAALLALIVVLVALVAALLDASLRPRARRGLVALVGGLVACWLVWAVRWRVAGTGPVALGLPAASSVSAGVGLPHAFDETVAMLVLGDGGMAWQVLSTSALSLLVASSLAAAVLAGRNACRPLFRRPSHQGADSVRRTLLRAACVLASPPVAAGVVGGGTVVVCLLASLLSAPVPATCCLLVIVGPLAVALSTVFVRARRPLVARLAVASLLVLSLAGQWWTVLEPVGSTTAASHAVVELLPSDGA